MTARPSALGDYLENSRRLSVSLTFVVPLLIGYEIALLHGGFALDNATGWKMFKWPLQQLFGANWFQILNGSLLIAFLIAYLRVERVVRAGWELYAGMLLESTIYAGLMGILAAALPGLLLATAGIDQRWVAEQILLSVGAGVYEELFFRLLLLGGLLVLFEDWVGLEGRWAAFAALVLSATAFSAMHYVGPGADKLTAVSFTFRYLAGVLLGLIYLQRGLGIAVYTHTLYDILVVLRQLAEQAS